MVNSAVPSVWFSAASLFLPSDGRNLHADAEAAETRVAEEEARSLEMKRESVQARSQLNGLCTMFENIRRKLVLGR